MECRRCFDQSWAKPALIDVAQPRWIGPRYFEARVKILVTALNPGAGKMREREDEEFRQTLYDYRDGKRTREDLFAFQKEDIPRWSLGRFESFYLKGMGLCLDEIALANIAWCADVNNKWPSQMLSKCFELHTCALIKILEPHVVVLSGSGIHKYGDEIRSLISNCRIIPTLHYAHRKGHKDEQEELQRVRDAIALVRGRCRDSSLRSE